MTDGVKLYNVTIPHEVSQIKVQAIPNSNHATVTSGNGNVDVQFNPINRNIVIEAENKDKSTYTLVITREKSSNADLTSIEIDGVLIDKFDKDTQEYTIDPVNSDVFSLNLTYTKANSYANASIVAGTNNLNEGDNQVVIRVVSQDGSNTKEYKINVKKKSGNANLSGLSITSSPQGDLTPEFNPNTKEYTYKYDRTVTSVNVNGTVLGGAMVQGNGSYNIPDTKEVVLDITAEDENVTSQVKIKFEQLLETDSSLSSLEVKNGSTSYTLSPHFNKNIKSYSLTVPGDVDQVTIEATPSGNYTKGVSGTGVTSLESGSNIKTVTVTAEDGSSTTYTINITRKINTNATVNDITIEGETIDDFDPSNATYYLVYGYDKDSITIGATASAGATLTGDVGLQNLKVGDNVFVLNVLAQDGVSTGKYTINVRRKSNDYSLSNLLVNSSPSSSVRTDDDGNYIVDVHPDATIITLVPTTTHENAVVTNLEDLENIDITNVTSINIEVTAEDDIYQGTHEIIINKLKSTNVYLSSLTVDKGVLSPQFKKDINEYTVSVDNETQNITVSAIAEDNKATVTGNDTYDLSFGENVITVTVTAEDGKTTNSYVIKVTRERNSIVTLSDLTIDGVTIDNFEPSKTDYTITVPFDKEEIIIDATPTDSAASVAGDGLGTKKLTNESNVFTFVVSAQDGSTQTYSITVNKEKPDTDNKLSSLVVLDYTLSPSFDSDVLDYSIGNVSDSTKNIKVEATPSSDSSTIKYKVNGVEVEATPEGIAIPDDLGPGTIEVIVTSQDGSEKTYTISYTKSEGGLTRIESTVHDIDYTDNYVLTVAPETKWEDLIKEFLNPVDELSLYNNDGIDLATGEVVRTGDMIKLSRDGNMLDFKYIVIKGDANGDGYVNISDAARVSSHDREERLLEGVYAKAGDANEDGSLNISDAARISSHDREERPLTWGKVTE